MNIELDGKTIDRSLEELHEFYQNAAPKEKCGEKSFPNHRGRPKLRGGSLPADAPIVAGDQNIEMDDASKLKKGHTYVDRYAYFITADGKLVDVYGNGYTTHDDALKDPRFREVFDIEELVPGGKDLEAAVERGAMQISIADKAFFITTNGSLNTALLERIQKYFDSDKFPKLDYKKTVILHTWPEDKFLEATIAEIMGARYLVQNSRGGFLKGQKEYEKDIQSFTRNVRHAIRAFWRGDILFGEFVDILSDQLEMELWNAWDEGIKECGMSLDDMKPLEVDLLQTAIDEQKEYVHSFAVDIAASNQAAGGKLAQFMLRGDMWITRYESIKTMAKLMVCGDQKLKWKWDPLKDHCETCRWLNGKVKRASIWREAGLQPQNAPNDRLECGGWLCGCSLDPTDEPQTPGPLPYRVYGHA